MMTSRRSCTFLAATFVGMGVSACESSRDDPGVDPQISGTPFEIDATPRLSLGLVEGDTLQEFHRVVTPFLLPDGNLVVPLSGASTIRVFSPDGYVVRSLGRSGDGPGEFRDLLAAWPRGDTIEALDSRLRRITRFLLDGSTDEVLIQTDLPDLSVAIGPVDGAWAVGGVAVGGTGRRDEIAVRRIARDGTDVGEIARSLGMARYEAAGLGSGPEPLSPTAAVAVANERVYMADGLIPRIQAFGTSGAQVYEYTWTVEPAAAASEVLQAVIDSAVARAAPDRAPMTRRRLEAAPTREQLPVLRRIVVDAQGFIWIQPYDAFQHAFALGGRLGSGGRWLILSPEGAEVGSVNVPPEIELHHVTSNAVVGIARDEMGVESVRVHGLHRR